MKALKPRHIMYSSCNATTLHRDWKLLADDYEMQALQPIDMFPFTHHFEVLAVLKRRTEIV
jgi:23S rRNA (uracil1939-C5)-methyltransferase